MADSMPRTITPGLQVINILYSKRLTWQLAGARHSDTRCPAPCFFVLVFVRALTCWHLDTVQSCTPLTM